MNNGTFVSKKVTSIKDVPPLVDQIPLNIHGQKHLIELLKKQVKKDNVFQHLFDLTSVDVGKFDNKKDIARVNEIAQFLGQNNLLRAPYDNIAILMTLPKSLFKERDVTEDVDAWKKAIEQYNEWVDVPCLLTCRVVGNTLRGGVHIVAKDKKTGTLWVTPMLLVTYSIGWNHETNDWDMNSFIGNKMTDQLKTGSGVDAELLKEQIRTGFNTWSYYLFVFITLLYLKQLDVLSVTRVRTPSKLKALMGSNKKKQREAREMTPLDEHIVRLLPSVGDTLKKEYRRVRRLGETKRPHDRRGTWVHRADGTVFWRRPCQIHGGGDHKTYKL